MIFWRKNKDKAEEGAEDTPDGNSAESVTAESPVAQSPVVQSPVTHPEPPHLELPVEAFGGLANVVGPAPVPAMEPEPEEDDAGWLSRLTKGLSKSTSRFTESLTGLITKRKLDQEMLDQLEDVLITADLGPKTAAAVVETFSRDRFGKDLSEEEIRNALADSIAEILLPVARPLAFNKPANGPMVVIVCGVNGVGKTTTIGKIAYNLQKKQHRQVMIAAGDTFRAAAVEQLDIWAARAGCRIVKKDFGADAAAVAFEAYEEAKRAGADILLIDTAGRLHNKSNLMAELQKIIRVLKKHDESLPHAVLLVLDATTGQNALEQVKIFKEMVDVTGLVVTKLDGSAKGGIVVALADQYKLPIHLVGVGEREDDLRPFDANHYARSLVGTQGF